jgi:hypothetical protein
MNVKVDRKSIDKMIKEISLFDETKSVLTAYQKEVSKLNEREEELNKQLEEIQEKHTQNLLDQESADVSELIYLKKMNRELVYETEVITSLLEELAEEKASLKIKYVPLINQAKREDMNNNAGRYNANEIVTQLRYEMLKIIADVSAEMKRQYRSVEPDVLEIFDDPKVKETFLERQVTFNDQFYKPSYSESMKTVISKDDVFYSLSGNVPSSVPKPKGVK